MQNQPPHRFSRKKIAVSVVLVTVAALLLWGAQISRVLPNPAGQWISENTEIDQLWHGLMDEIFQGHAPPGLAASVLKEMNGRVPPYASSEPAPPLDATQFLVPAGFRLPSWFGPNLTDAERNSPDGPRMALALTLTWSVSAGDDGVQVLSPLSLPGGMSSLVRIGSRQQAFNQGLAYFLDDLTRYRRLDVTLVIPENYGGDRQALATVLTPFVEEGRLRVATQVPEGAAQVGIEGYLWRDGGGGFAIFNVAHVNMQGIATARDSYTTIWHEFFHVLGVPHPDSSTLRVLWGSAYTMMSRNSRMNGGFGFHHDGMGYLDHEILDTFLGAPDLSSRFGAWESCDVFRTQTILGPARIFVTRSPETGESCLAFVSDSAFLNISLDPRFGTNVTGNVIYMHPHTAPTDVVIATTQPANVFIGESGRVNGGVQRIHLQGEGEKVLRVLWSDAPDPDAPIRRVITESPHPVSVVFDGTPSALGLQAAMVEGTQDVELRWRGGSMILQDQLATHTGTGISAFGAEVPGLGSFLIQGNLASVDGINSAFRALDLMVETRMESRYAESFSHLDRVFGSNLFLDVVGFPQARAAWNAMKDGTATPNAADFAVMTLSVNTIYRTYSFPSCAFDECRRNAMPDMSDALHDITFLRFAVLMAGEDLHARYQEHAPQPVLAATAAPAR